MGTTMIVASETSGANFSSSSRSDLFSSVKDFLDELANEHNSDFHAGSFSSVSK